MLQNLNLLTTFATLTLVCPLCKKHMLHYELSSYHIFDSTLYSDGKADHSNRFLEDKNILLCPHCNKVFWRNDAHETEEMLESEEPLSSKSVMDFEFALSENYPERIAHYYHSLINEGFADTTEREIYLRMLLWRSINDLIRYQSPVFKLIGSYVLKRPIHFLKSRWSANKAFWQFKRIQKENLDLLTALFNPINENDLLLKAEMYREAGERKKALQVLKQIGGTNSYYKRKIKTATLLFKIRVFKLN